MKQSASHRSQDNAASAQPRLKNHAAATGGASVQLADFASNPFAAIANDSPRAMQMKLLAQGIDASPRMTAQRKAMATLLGDTAQRREADKPNRTGLPGQLKSGMESLSGMSMDHVKVHYNSPQPAQLNAHAYAQGSDIHIAPGQEQHLPHEAWHVVQQAQGRVAPTMQMKEGVPVNDDAGLEREADVMGAKALQQGMENGQESGLEARAEIVSGNLPSPRANPVQRLANRHGLTALQYQQRSGFTVFGWGRLTGPGGTVNLTPVTAGPGGHAEDQLINEANGILALVPAGTYDELEVWVSSSPCSTVYGTRAGVPDGCLEELEDFSNNSGLDVFVHAQKPYQPRGMGTGMKQNSVNAANGSFIPHDFDTRTGIANGLNAYVAPPGFGALGTVAQLVDAKEAGEPQKDREEGEKKKGKFTVVYE
jgi:hypothetical protein